MSRLLEVVVALQQAMGELRAGESKVSGVPESMRELHEEHGARRREIEALEAAVEKARRERVAAEGAISDAQEKLKHYQQQRQITIMLSSHYMKDVAALCQRVVIITHGQIRYDGSLSGIIDRFSGQKLVTLSLADDAPLTGLERFGQFVESQRPKVKLRIDRGQVAKALAAILAQHAVEDIAVEDPPLEEVIADLYSQVQHDAPVEPEPIAAR